MSARALQRVVVRMLYDPALVDALYAGRDDAVADAGLSPAQIEWLRAPDRRRWAADPLRRTRGLQALLEEYPVAAALAARRHGVATLDGFFSAAAFHRCVQTRGSLADTFGRWLATLGGPAVHAMATLERGVARVRRAPQPRAPVDGPLDGRWQTAPWAFGAAVPGGSLAGWQRLRARLAQHPGGAVAALLDGDFDLGPPPALDPAAPEGLVVERTGPGEGDVAVGGCDPALGSLLARLAGRPHSWSETADAVRALGAEADEVAEVVRSLREGGLLTQR